ncbi:MAG: methyltransferase domain-containing protein [Rhodobacter sp.]|nr:methyltransferase domain-containing protein [Rhodobacter sp.]
MAKPGLAPRRSAVFLLCQVIGEGRLLSELLPRALDRLAPEERARAQRLTVATLRWMDRADRMLGPHLKKRPPLEVLNTLRLGVVEMAVGGAAPHGVVDAAVDLLREGRRTAGLAGLANAVLRKVAADLPKWDALPVPRLPKWLRGPLVDAYGKSVIADIEAAHAAGAPLDITLKSGPVAGLNAVELPTGSLRLADPGQVTALPGYTGGDWWVQDAAAAIPARILAATPGESVLDMCAAPGGKTLQLAAGGARVTTLDISKSRVARIAENLERTGLSAELVVADALQWDSPAGFDAILLDAPCSATGTVRRHPDLPYAKDGSGFMALFELQEQMLDRAIALLRPGGRLVYCTCSLLPDEGEVQVDAALQRHAQVSVDPDALMIPGVSAGWQVENGLRLRPDYWAEYGGMDGFFIAALRKTA